jgi:Arc/MetJ-type ribon-helix-helix transcriptional regulator
MYYTELLKFQKVFMQIELSPADASYISQLVKNGYFANEAEAVSATIGNAREQYKAKVQRLNTALQKGRDAIKAGDYTEYTPELLDELFAEAMAEEERGEPLEIDTDVIP